MQVFQKQCRLVSKQDFQSVFASAKKIAKKNLVLLYIPAAQDRARLGVIIAKQQIRLAVSRNRCRRIIRESFRNAQLPPLDIIIIVRHGAQRLSKPALRLEVDQLWQSLSKLV